MQPALLKFHYGFLSFNSWMLKWGKLNSEAMDNKVIEVISLWLRLMMCLTFLTFVILLSILLMSVMSLYYLSAISYTLAHFSIWSCLKINFWFLYFRDGHFFWQLPTSLHIYKNMSPFPSEPLDDYYCTSYLPSTPTRFSFIRRRASLLAHPHLFLFILNDFF